MFPGCPPGCAPGDTRDMILELSGAFVGGQAICILTPNDWYRERWWTFFIGGKWCGKNYYLAASGNLEIALPLDSVSDIASIWPIEVGPWDNFGPDDIPDAEALFEEANDADVFVIKIKANYQLTTVKGDSQLSSIVVAGARRGRNVEDVPYFKQRGRLRYSITTYGASVAMLRWYAGDRLVAEGSVGIVGPTTFSCTEKNGSGLTISGNFTYTADVKLRSGSDGAFLDLKWPKSFPIHYSTGALIYPRTPEAIIYDNGNDEYFYLVRTSLPAGSYNYNVLQVDDEGDEQTSIAAPSDSPKVITPGPIGPTIVSVTAAGLITWTNGESGCTYKVYYSNINEPINYGNRASPAPVGPSALNATSASLGALTGAAATDFTSNYATLVTAWDAAVAAASLKFDMLTPATRTADWLAALATLRTALYAAVDVWAAAIGKSLNDPKTHIDQQISILEGVENSVTNENLTSAEWEDFTGTYYGGLLQFLGAILEGQSGRYLFLSGIVPGAAPAGTGSVTGNAPDGTAGSSGMTFQQSLKAAGEPFVRVGVRRFVVRATNAAGVEERNDQVFRLEINGSNAAELPRPNDAQIKEMSFANGVLTVVAIVHAANQKVAATAVDLYVVTTGSAITLGSASATGTLSVDLGGYKQVTLQYTMPGAGWYDIAVAARSAAGQRSENYPRRTHEYGGGTVPGAVSSISAQVQRNRGSRPEEA